VLAGLCLVASVAAIQAQTAPAKSMPAAEGKVDSSWKCAAPAPVNMLPAGDQPDHAYVLQQFKCTATKGEIAGIKETEGTGVEVMEATGNTGKGHGTFVESLANGDKLIVSYETSGTMSNKMFQSGTNKWTVKSATGKLKGIKGSGSCAGTGNPDGSANFTCTGTYTMPK